MKISGSHITVFLSRIGALCLLLIFMSIPMIEALHSHHEAQECATDKTVKLAKIHQANFSAKHIVKTTLKCKLCDLLKHSDFQFSVPQYREALYYAPPVVKLASFYRMQHCAAFVLACANKGPPASIHS